MRSLSYAISILLHPVFMPVFTLLLLFQLDPFLTHIIPKEALWRVIAAVGITTGILPALSVFILSKAQVVESVELRERKERLVPFIMTLFYFIATYLLLMKAALPSVIYSALMGGTVALAGLILMTCFQRISAHLCAYGTLVGTMAGVFSRSPFPFQELLVLLILLGGILGSARVFLNAHSPRELLIGALWGFLSSFYFVSRDIHYLDHSLFG